MSVRYIVNLKLEDAPGSLYVYESLRDVLKLVGDVIAGRGWNGGEGDKLLVYEYDEDDLDQRNEPPCIFHI